MTAPVEGLAYRCAATLSGLHVFRTRHETEPYFNYLRMVPERDEQGVIARLRWSPGWEPRAVTVTRCECGLEGGAS